LPDHDEEAAMAEARIEDGVPVTGGWFVLNARDAPWMHNDMRAVAKFGGQGEAHFDELGIALYWLEPGQPMAMYHHEAGQEDFLVLRGRALAIVEGDERALQPWDLFHCPPRTPHTIVGAGDDPALILAVGARTGAKGSARYPVDATAVRHGAGVDHETDAPYARFSEPERGPAPDAF
jgi:quercetin dioxygenase-like cupin family protein